MKRRIMTVVIAATVLVVVLVYSLTRPQRQLVLTGIVTTDEVNVGAEIGGRLEQLLVREGDSVTNGQLLAMIQPQIWQADVAYYASTERQSAAQVAVSEADLKFQQAQTSNQITQAEATFAATEAAVTQAEADLENARLTFKRLQDLRQGGVESAQTFDQARTARESAEARVDSLRKQALAARAAVALAKSNAEQVAARRAAVEANIQRLAAAGAQSEKAKAQLDYTRIRAPISGIINTRAALQGEVVNPGQAIVTLIDPDNLWIRADVEESYIDRIRLGDRILVRLPSGAEREGTVFFRAVDADYATQRDVSRTKRDIKTFQIRLRCDNRDRRLAVGMTAYVALPLATQ